jgi:hypothetical protein
VKGPCGTILYIPKWIDSHDRKNKSLHIELHPGGRSYFDFAGSKITIADTYTNEIIEVEVLVAVSAAQNLLHLPAFCQLIHQFIQIPDFLS